MLAKLQTELLKAKTSTIDDEDILGDKKNSTEMVTKH